MFRKLKSIIFRDLYVTCDARDNSVTFSKRLYKRLEKGINDNAKIYVTKLTDSRRKGAPSYCFILNPDLTEETQLADIMYNGKHNCIGFESLCPTVNRIFYDYNIAPDGVCRLSVLPGRTRRGGIRYYEICRPDGK